MGYGKHRLPAPEVLRATESAIADLQAQLEVLRNEPADNPVPIGELVACRINSGKFGVRWERTREVLVKTGVELTVVDGT